MEIKISYCEKFCQKFFEKFNQPSLRPSFCLENEMYFFQIEQRKQIVQLYSNRFEFEQIKYWVNIKLVQDFFKI